MQTESMHALSGFGRPSSSTSGAASPEEIPVEIFRERLHEEKQPVHENWWVLTLFAAALPMGLCFAFRLGPIGEFMKADAGWSPNLTDRDIQLLDITAIAPSVMAPVMIGMAMDAAWSLNLALLICLITSVLGQFMVAMGIAWHSFRLALTGRFVGGLCIGPILVICDTIAAQFNRRRRGVTFAALSSISSVFVSLNTYSWVNEFTRESLQGEYEKMSDIFLIVSLLSLGVGFLWAPMVSSFDMEDSPKRRYWKWHMPSSMWALAFTQVLFCMFHAGISTSRSSLSWELMSTIIVGPVLGYSLDKSGLSQGGSLTACYAIILALCFAVLGTVSDMPWLLGLSMGSVWMLLRCVVPQIASRDCLSTSFGILEGSLVLGWILYSNIELTRLGELACALFSLCLVTMILVKLRRKWKQLRLPEIAQPLYGRGG